jgi:hypothetical protein
MGSFQFALGGLSRTGLTRGFVPSRKPFQVILKQDSQAP